MQGAQPHSVHPNPSANHQSIISTLQGIHSALSEL